MSVEVIGEIKQKQVIAVGRRIREISRLRKVYGPGRWRKLKALRQCISRMIVLWKRSYIGMKRMASAKRNSRSSASSDRAISRRGARPRFVVCVQNKDYEASLQVRRIYRALSDDRAASHHYLRVIDESGEDYLYRQRYFVAIELPRAVKKALLLAS